MLDIVECVKLESNDLLDFEESPHLKSGVDFEKVDMNKKK